MLTDGFLGSKFRIKRNSVALHLAVLLTSIVFSPMPSEAASGYTAPEVTAKDANGVDLGTGILFRTQTFLTIGDPSNGGLAWSYSGVWGSDSFDGKVIYQAADLNIPRLYTVSIGSSTTVFYQNCATGSCYSGAADDATLVKVGSNWIFTTHDGTVYTFDVASDSSGKLLSIKRPNGFTTTIGYVSPTCAVYCAVDFVASNAGYALKYTYGTIPTLKAVNLTSHSCDAAINCADGYDATLSFGTYSTTGPNGFSYGGRSIIDALGNTSVLGAEDITTYQDGIITGLLYARSPAGVETFAEYDIFSRVKKIITPIGAWSYSYSDGNITAVQLTGPHNVTVKDPANSTIYTAVATKVFPRVSSQTDALNRTTSFQAQSALRPGTTNNYYSMPTGATLPEGNKSSYVYDARGNVTSITNTPKTGSGLSPTSSTASYPTTCTYVKTCNQPIWTKDAKFNQTDYTYDNNHGGLLTVTLPADQTALRQRTYNTYTAFDTGAGLIYRVTRTETCGLTAAQLSLTACPTLASTSVSVINYGTPTTAPKTYKTNLPLTVTQTDGASTLSATTTYAYDNIGNVISVDGPLAGTADQSFTTYDANRRKIFEIGPIPGGNGTQKRTLVRHIYNGDGQEIQTAQGYANSNLTNGSDAVIISYSQMNYDIAGRLAATIVETTGNVAP